MTDDEKWDKVVRGKTVCILRHPRRPPMTQLFNGGARLALHRIYGVWEYYEYKEVVIDRWWPTGCYIKCQYIPQKRKKKGKKNVRQKDR